MFAKSVSISLALLFVVGPVYSSHDPAQYMAPSPSLFSFQPVLSPFLSFSIVRFSHETERRQEAPLIIVLPTDQATPSGAATPDDMDGETAPIRAMKAAEAVRDLLNQSKTVQAVLYSPDTPLFVRAALEAKIQIKRRYNLTVPEQTALSKAAGAVYVVVIAVRKAADNSGYDVLLTGTDNAGKTYTDTARYLVEKPEIAANSDALPRTGTVTANARTTAANTLVLRLLNSPLAEFGRATPPPTLISEAAPTKDLIDTRLREEADVVTATLQQSRTLLADGNTDGAVVLLRHAVNQAPLNRPLRLELARAYLAQKQSELAVAEVRRAMTLIPSNEPADRKEVAQLLAKAFQQDGDTTAARTTYEAILADQPSALWARLALAEILVSQQETDAAGEHYRAVLKVEPNNKEAARGLSKLLAARGDFDTALNLVAPAGASDKATRYDAVAAIFDEVAGRIAALMRQNRAVWEAKKQSREAFYKDTQTQVRQSAALVTLLKANPAPPTEDGAKKAQNRRVLAATLLSQSANALLTFLETGDKEADAQTTLLLTEFEKELALLRD